MIPAFSNRNHNSTFWSQDLVLATSLYNQATLLFQQNPKQAKKYYSLLLSQTSSASAKAVLLFNIALCQQEQGKNQQAFDLYIQGLMLSPKDEIQYRLATNALNILIRFENLHISQQSKAYFDLMTHRPISHPLLNLIAGLYQALRGEYLHSHQFFRASVLIEASKYGLINFAISCKQHKRLHELQPYFQQLLQLKLMPPQKKIVQHIALTYSKTLPKFKSSTCRSKKQIFNEEKLSVSPPSISVQPKQSSRFLKKLSKNGLTLRSNQKFGKQLVDRSEKLSTQLQATRRNQTQKNLIRCKALQSIKSAKCLLQTKLRQSMYLTPHHQTSKSNQIFRLIDRPLELQQKKILISQDLPLRSKNQSRIIIEEESLADEQMAQKSVDQKGDYHTQKKNLLDELAHQSQLPIDKQENLHQKVLKEKPDQEVGSVRPSVHLPASSLQSEHMLGDNANSQKVIKQTVSPLPEAACSNSQKLSKNIDQTSRNEIKQPTVQLISSHKHVAQSTIQLKPNYENAAQLKLKPDHQLNAHVQLKPEHQHSVQPANQLKLDHQLATYSNSQDGILKASIPHESSQLQSTIQKRIQQPATQLASDQLLAPALSPQQPRQIQIAKSTTHDDISRPAIPLTSDHLLACATYSQKQVKLQATNQSSQKLLKASISESHNLPKFQNNKQQQKLNSLNCQKALHRQPDKALHQLYKQKKYQECLSYPCLSTPNQLLIKAKCHYRMNNLKAALALLEPCLCSQTDFLYYKLGWWHLKSGLVEKGLELLEKAIVLNDQRVYINRFAIGSLQQRDSQVIRLAVHFLNRLTFQPQSSYLKCLAYQKLQDFQAMLFQARVLAASSPNYKYLVVQALLKAGNVPAALLQLGSSQPDKSTLQVLLKWISSKPVSPDFISRLQKLKDSEIQCEVGLYYYRARDYQKSEKCLKESLYLETNRKALINLCWCLIKQLKLRKALELVKEKQDYLGVSGQKLLAVIFFKSNKYKQALQIMETLPVRQLENYFLEIKGHCSFFSNLHQEALQSFRKIPQDRRSSQVWHRMALILAQHKNHQACFECFQNALFKEETEEILYNFASCLNNANKYQEAFRILERLIELFPKHYQGLVQISCYYQLRGQFQEARKCLERAIELRWSEGLLKRLQEIKRQSNTQIS